MTDTKFTPGPYELTPAGIWAIAPWGERILIAKVIRHHAGDGIDPDANGHLLAAAWDLYVALQSARNLLSDYPVAQKKGYVSVAWETADAALAKARGAK